MAQYQSPGQINPGQVNIRSENTLFVPEGGLKIVNARNRVLGMFAESQGNGSLILNNSEGQPAVFIAASSQGIVIVGGTNAPSLTILGPKGTEGVNIAATEREASVVLRGGTKFSSSDSGGRVTLFDPGKVAGIDLAAERSGGRLTLSDSSKKKLFELKCVEGAGSLALFNEEGETGFKAIGSGSAEIQKDKETLWKVPADK